MPNSSKNIIPTPSVVVSFTKEPMDRLFKAGGSVKSLMKTIAGDDDLILFNHDSNPNFISFEYQFTLGGGEHVATLKFIDPNNEFEDRYFRKGFEENIAGFRPSFDLNEVTKEGQALNLKSEFFRRYVQSYGQKEIYVAFGSGPDLRTWAGPYKMYVMGANLETREGKVITLQLYPTPEGFLKGDRRTATRQLMNLNLNGLTVLTTGKSEQLNIGITRTEDVKSAFEREGFGRVYTANAYEPGKAENQNAEVQKFIFSVYDKLDDEIKLSTEAINNYFGLTPGVAAIMGGVDFHNIIVDTLRDYIRNATGRDNVIVLLPNLNLLLLDYINQETQRVIKENEAALSAARSAKIRSRLAPPRRAGLGSIAASKKAAHAMRSDLLNQSMWYTAIKTIMEDLGFHLLMESTDPTKKHKSLPPYKTLTVGADDDATTKLENFFSTTEFKIGLKTLSTNLIPDHEKTVKEILANLESAMMGRYPLKPIIYTENNPKFLELWADNRVGLHRTFAGPDGKFKKNQECIILGDTGMIQSYLYARKDLVERKDVKEVQEFQNAEKALNKINSKITQTEAEIAAYDVSSLSTLPEGIALTEELNLLKTKKAEARFTMVNAFVNQAGNNQLAPIDASILNKDYQNYVRSQIWQDSDAITSTAYGPLYDVPDEFAVGKTKLPLDAVADRINAELKAERAQFPIFTFNTSNPNITKLKSDLSFSYFAALRTGYAKKIARQAAGVVTGQLKSSHAELPITTFAEAVRFLVSNDFSMGICSPAQKAVLVEELTKRLTVEAVEDFNVNAVDALDRFPDMPLLRESVEALQPEALVYDVGELANRVAAIVDLFGDSTAFKSFILVDQERPGGSEQIMAQLLTDAYRRGITLTIETLPLFHMSDVGGTVLNNCIVFAQDPQIIRSGKVPKTNFFNYLLSGVYQIMGFKHKILGSGEASSEFALIGGPVPMSAKQKGNN